MKLLNSLVFPLFLIFFLLEPCQALSQSALMITDLENLDSTGFTNEANSWVWKGVPCPDCIFSMPSGSSCDSVKEGQMIFGGPRATSGGSLDYFEKTYSPPTTSWTFIGFGFEVWAFATSELSNAATISRGQIYQPKMGTSSWSGGDFVLTSSCSTDFTNSQGTRILFIYKYEVRATLSFGGPVSPLRFGIKKSSAALAAVDSIGIRNLRIFNLNSVPNIGNLNLPCAAGYRWTGTTCQACYITCQSCSGFYQDQCTACKINSYDDGNGGCRTSCTPPFQQIPGKMKCENKCSPSFYWARTQSCIESCEDPLVKSLDGNGAPLCSSPCSDATQFVYPDKSCLSACNPLLKDKSEPTLKLCLNPCETSSMFVYPDGTCDDACPTPFSKRTETNVEFCYSTCPSTAKFIYPDKSCSPTCDPPLTSFLEHGISSCRSACRDSGEYLYPDGSCKICPLPFTQKIENDIQYCENPCFHNNTFLYEDRTCQEACPLPSIAKNDPSIGKTCKYPCANVAHYYNNRNGKCTKTCEYTSVAIESPLPKICFSTLSEEEVKSVQAVADTANSANSASSTGSMIWSIVSSSDSTAACLGPLAKMLQYIKFMDIRFPEKVLILMDAQSKNSEGFAAKMMRGVLEKFPSHELPRKFKVYQSSSSFFVNFWPAFFNLVMILLVTGLVVIGTAKTKGHPKTNGILKNLMEILKWNVFLITFSGSVGDIVLYTSMEFQTVQFDSFAAVFSFLLCLGTNTLAVMIVMKIIFVNSAVRKSKKQTKDEEEHKKIIEQEWSNYKALFECYKDYSFYQQVFLFVFLVRLALFNAMVGYLYNYPLFQATIAVVSNILMLGYLIIKRPMKKMVSLIQQIVLELVLLPFNVCVLALAIMDHHEIVGTDHRKSIGNVIVYINLMVPILSLVLMAIKAIAMGIDFYKSWKLAKANKVKKLAGVQKDFRPNDIFNHTTEGLQFQTQTEFPSPTKSFAEHVQTLDFMDHSTFSLEQHSNPIIGRDQRIRSDFMMNNSHDHQNSIPTEMGHQSFIAPDYQQQPQFQARIMQEQMLGQQNFQNERMPNMMPRPQNHRRRINKRRRDPLPIQNNVFSEELRSIEQ